MAGTDPDMKSQNFEFLRTKRGVLADLAGFAEQYVHADPTSSLFKQRSFIEQVVAIRSTIATACVRPTRTTSRIWVRALRPVLRHIHKLLQSFQREPSMELFTLLPVACPPPGFGPWSWALANRQKVEIVRTPDALDGLWQKDFGMFQAAEFAQTNFVVAVVADLDPQQDTDRQLASHERSARKILKAMRLQGYPGHRESLRLTGICSKSSWQTKKASITHSRLLHSWHAQSPWEAGNWPAPVLGISSRLATLYDDPSTDQTKHMRLRRCFRTAEIAMEMDNAYERFPMMARVIEGLVAVGGRKPQDALRARIQYLASSAEPTAEVIGDIYRVRNKIMHMDDWKTAFARRREEEKEPLAQSRYACAEVLAISLISQILSSDSLFAVYEEDSSIGRLWTEIERGNTPNPWITIPQWDTAQILRWSAIPGVPPTRG